jgi:MFS superfamily sulfate permease-like transporter
VLGAIVVMAAAHLIRVEDLRHLRVVSRSEFMMSLLALLGVLFLGLLDGLLLAAAGSLVMLIAHASRPAVVGLGREAESGRFVSQMRHPGSDDTPGALVVRCAGAWLYFNADHIRRSIVAMVDDSPATTMVVIDFSIVPAVDVTAAGALRALASSLQARGIAVALAELHDNVADILRAARIERELGPIAAHRTIESCLAAAAASRA